MHPAPRAPHPAPRKSAIRNPQFVVHTCRRMSPLEIVAVAVTLTCVWMMVRQNIWTFPLGLVAVTLYSIVFFRSQLYGQVMLQAVFFAFNVYGWYEWLFGGEGKTKLRVRKTPRATLVLLLALGAGASAGLGYWFANHTDNASPYLDATLTAYSLVAQFLTAKKWLESWHIWITVDVAYVWLFASTGLLPTAGLYAVFVVLASMGLVEWKRSWQADQAADA
jgi:nicotinamide mononucleotide transporter